MKLARNKDRAIKDLDKIIRRLRNMKVTLSSLAEDYGCTPYTMKKVVLTKMKMTEYMKISRAVLKKFNTGRPKKQKGIDEAKSVNKHRSQFEEVWICIGCGTNYGRDCPEVACPMCLGLRFRRDIRKAG